MTTEQNYKAGIERRAERRTACHWPALCRRDGHSADQVVVIDASTGGFCISSTIPVETGQNIVLELEEIGVFSCEVRWTASDRFGVLIQSSAQELTASDVEDLAQRLDLAAAVA